MDDRRWREVKGILDAASRLAPEARSGFVQQACGGDPAVRDEVVSLLAFHDATRDVLGRPAFDVNAEDPRVGRRIGHYRIARLLGRGGMGKVYLAMREDDYAQQVAIKLIQQGLDAEDRIARFHEERQILADLEHPSIARLLDGGTTDDGLPYLVMELVEGEPIDRYCNAQGLDLRRRLELFREVLGAVDIAHRHLVVHRDLKPGNVLVTAGGVPKLIDFGIAKPLHEDGGAAPRRRLMSPGYASPEQVRGERVTTASDVYSLGVLLYLLLSGRHPYRDEGTSEEDLERAVCETTPAAPSAAVREPPPGVDGSARRWRRRLAGDPDAIVMKAMRKRPEERYASAAQFADDVGRYLSGHPIRARPSSLPYRTHRFIRRHRLALAAVVVALVALASSVVTFALRSRAASERAQREAIETFLHALFRAADPDRADGEELSVRELLDRGRDELGVGLEEHPLVLSALFAVVGRVYENLGDLRQAEPLLAEALELQRRHGPRDDPVVARRANDLGMVLRQKGDVDGAEALYREALGRLGGCRSEHPDALWITGNLAWLRATRGDEGEAESLLACLLERVRSGAPKDAASSVLNKLGALRFGQRRFEEAEALFREALVLREEFHEGSDHTVVARALNNLGRTLLAQGKHEEAVDVLRRAVEVRRKLLPPGHADLAISEENLAEALAGDASRVLESEGR